MVRHDEAGSGITARKRPLAVTPDLRFGGAHLIRRISMRLSFPWQSLWQALACCLLVSTAQAQTRAYRDFSDSDSVAPTAFNEHLSKEPAEARWPTAARLAATAPNTAAAPTAATRAAKVAANLVVTRVATIATAAATMTTSGSATAVVAGVGVATSTAMVKVSAARPTATLAATAVARPV